MTTEISLRRYRAEANKYRTDISRASSAVAAHRKKAADATSAANRSKNASTIKAKLAEAERATKAANDSEKKRADLEKKLADVEKKIAKAEEMYQKEQLAAQKKAVQDLRRRTDRAASQFGPPDLAGLRRSMAASPRQPDTSGSESPHRPPVADVFLSHSFEDKDDIARPLKEALETRGVTVWFDEIRIKVGQSIRQEIEAGIRDCRFGVVIISPSFFKKKWTQAELDALFSKKMDSGQDIVLPVWHHISKDEVSRQSPLLAGILALNSATMTIEEMADALTEAILGRPTQIDSMSTQDPHRPRVFISHSRSDASAAALLARSLAPTFPVTDWLDAASGSASDHWSSDLRALAATDVVVLLLSPAATSSRPAMDETKTFVDEARLRDIDLVPVLLEPSDIPEHLQERQVVDLTPDGALGVGRLIARLRGQSAIDFKRLDGRTFAKLIQQLLQREGFDVPVLEQRAGDHGVDMLATRGTRTWLVEVKHTPVDRPSVRVLDGLVRHLDAQPNSDLRALLITSGQLTSVARTFLEKSAPDLARRIDIIDGPELEQRLVKHLDLVASYFGDRSEAEA
jgi:hypothetical protein